MAHETTIKKMNKVLWFTGLSGSGKTTIANALQHELDKLNIESVILDGDVMRKTISADLGFSIDDREAHIKRMAYVAQLFASRGIVVLCCFISPTRAIRSIAMEICGEDVFHVIHVDASVEVCRARDVKGLYAKQKRGEIEDFTGVTSPYEPPRSPFLTLDTEELTVNECVDLIIKKIRL